jgi:SH3-like domain-containing protein
VKNQPLNLLIGLAVISTSVVINTGVANQVVLARTKNLERCNIFAYVIDQDTKGVNVRSGVSSKSRILGTIPANETVNVIGYAGNWARVTKASAGFQGTGWVYLPMLGISSRGYETNGVNLYAHPNQKSRKVGRVPANLNLKLLGCKGSWAYVEYNTTQGWLAREDQCGAALTSCS